MPPWCAGTKPGPNLDVLMQALSVAAVWAAHLFTTPLHGFSASYKSDDTRLRRESGGTANAEAYSAPTSRPRTRARCR